MGVFDQTARYAALAEPGAVIARVLRGELLSLRFREWVDTRTTPKPGDPDRTADRVAALDDGRDPARPWLLVFEFQSRHEDDKLDVTLTEAARLRAEARHGDDRRGKYRVMVAMVYLRGLCPEVTIDMTLPSGRGTRHVVLTRDVETDDAEAALDELTAGRTTWGILFWVPLMRGGGGAEVIRRWLEFAQAMETESRQSDLRRVALIFAELAGCLVAWQDALEGWQMKTESQVVNRLIEKAEEDARLQERRGSLLDLLNEKFPGQVTPEVTETINQQPGLALLRTWFGEAAAAVTFADFVAVLRR